MKKVVTWAAPLRDDAACTIHGMERVTPIKRRPPCGCAWCARNSPGTRKGASQASQRGQNPLQCPAITMCITPHWAKWASKLAPPSLSTLRAARWKPATSSNRRDSPIACNAMAGRMPPPRAHRRRQAELQQSAGHGVAEQLHVSACTAASIEGDQRACSTASPSIRRIAPPTTPRSGAER